MTLPGPEIVIFTDLDGTLLSAEDYDPGCSIEALERCKKAGIPVVFVSSKTRSEIEALRVELKNEDPFISENGGAIYLPSDRWEKPRDFIETGRYWRRSLGTPHEILIKELMAAAETCRTQIEMFSRLPLDRIMELTGLSREEARRGQMREFDEPFRIRGEDPSTLSCLEKELQDKGFILTRGGRFYHIIKGCDKGKAVQLVMGLYRTQNPHVRFGAVGDAENDLPMLQAVDHPFLVRKQHGGYEKGANIAGFSKTDGIGPEGFIEAVNILMDTS